MIYLVYLLQQRQELNENPMPMRRDRDGQIVNTVMEYTTRYHPDLLGAYDGDTPQQAAVAAAHDTKRFGQYVAVEATVMELGFSASSLPALNASSEDDDDAPDPYGDD
ncbi:MAG TPA: hypothetical protein VMP89_05950 [Solirubrobacteraceae bacterium]|nr:hypothetical protein [Solirubrobacteraceae bacterium]